ncbi:hypothetical protein CEXT_600641 [Caerostris extrusa]|uniref:Uncharacterized protein n=1 Tax=Caerostris extrusa TaxID=172846 RepID=A0AAV4X6W9_CAEEX|nr:hypothetical protein CEXT_600641 [Caerostris extrusa]
MVEARQILSIKLELELLTVVGIKMTSQLHPAIIRTVIVWSPPPFSREEKGVLTEPIRGLMRCLRSWRRFRAADQQRYFAA